MDLSAAFDLIRPDIFTKRAIEVLPENMVWLIKDFITERKAFVEIGQSSSSIFTFKAGCPQGSTLGPKVFNIYCRNLHEIIDSRIVTYADDSYVIIEAPNDEDLREKAERVMTNHLEWLDSNGMVCNVEKTEMLFMGQENANFSITVRGREIKSMKEMKVLGVTFDPMMKWDAQVQKAVQKSSRMLHGLKNIRKYLSHSQASQIATSFFYSVLYYGCEIWHHRYLSYHLKQKVKSAHYRALRMIYGIKKTRDELDKIGRRANPEEWANYSIAKLAAQMIQRGKPRGLVDTVLMNSYDQRRVPGRLFFYDSSQKKIGRQQLKNRLQCVSKRMNFQWLTTTKDSLRTSLKKCFFSYYRH